MQASSLIYLFHSDIAERWPGKRMLNQANKMYRAINTDLNVCSNSSYHPCYPDCGFECMNKAEEMVSF